MIQKKEKLLNFWIYCIIMMLLSCGQQVVHEWDNDLGIAQGQFFKVAKVLTGNSIQLEDGRVIQYIGLQSIPTHHPFYQKAYNANAELLSRGAAKVFLEFDVNKQDAHGNYLAYVFSPVSSEQQKVCCFVNTELLLFGYAALDTNSMPYKYKQKFVEAQKQAKQNKRGLWASE